NEINRPTRRPELCFIALAGDEVVGYAALQVFGDEAHHGLTATRRDWRRRGVATALKRAEIAAAKRAGFKRLLTESEERNEPMRRLNEKLGFVPAPEWSTVVMRGPSRRTRLTRILGGVSVDPQQGTRAPQKPSQHPGWRVDPPGHAT